MTEMFIALVVLIVIGVPVSFAIGVASLFGVISLNVPVVVTVQRMFSGLDAYTLLAIPFFILAGNLMDSGGISRRLIKLSSALVGHIRGGLAMVCVLASMLFGCVSGSAAAACAAIGPIMLPGMKEKGYEPEFSSALIACSGPLGSIIPPSLTMVIYGASSNASIGKMFLGGYIPGILIGVAIMLLCYFFAVKRNYPAGKKATAREVVHTSRDAIWALLTAIIIVAGIMSGIFTATEASAVAVIYALFVGLFVYKELRLRDLPAIFFRSVVTSATVLFCVATSTILGWVMTRLQIPAMVANWITATISSKFLFLLLINVIFLILGCIMDASPAILLSVPILLPIAESFGINPVHFGIIVVINLAVGMSTPPVGITLFVTSSISKLPISKMVKHLIPFWVVQITILILVTYIPAISMWLPNMLMK